VSVQEEENRSYVGGIISSFHEVAVNRSQQSVCNRDDENNLMERDS